MRKRLIFIYSCIIISVVFQLVMYTFVDKVYLRGRENIAASLRVTTEGSTGSETKIAEEPETSVDIPSNARNVEVSYDGKYVAYTHESKLYVVEVETKEVKKVVNNQFITPGNSQNKVEANITCFKWVSNKNVIVYGLSSLKEAPEKGQIFTYDVGTGNEHIGVTFTEGYMPRGGELSDLVISPLTMVFYAKVKANNQERLFRVDLMDQMFPSITINSGTVTKIGYFSEDLVYEDGNGKLCVKSGFKSPYEIKSDKNTALLNVVGDQKEGKDKVYAGQINEQNKVAKVLFGNQAVDMAEWKAIELEKPVSTQDLIIKQGGEIYTVNRDEGVVTNVQKSTKVKFKGNFLDIINNHIVYIDGNTLKFKPLDKK